MLPRRHILASCSRSPPRPRSRRPRRPPRASPSPSRRRASCSTSTTRDRTLDEIRDFGVTQVRQLVYWKRLRAAPERQAQAARRFDAVRLGDLPGRHVGAARPADGAPPPRAGIRVHLNLTGPVPRWATKSRKDNVTRPSAKEFQAWATAVGRRYGDQVETWSIWNEPNQPQFLMPQYRNGQPVLARASTARLYKAGVQGAQEDRRQPRRHVPDRRDLAARQLEGRVPARLLPAACCA